ncbi:MAG: hypothetical protein KDA64_18305 [Rhodospirillaceae bacterium]|nr:hypothetical protein [Rhodospirillaceae bacterium]
MRFIGWLLFLIGLAALGYDTYLFASGNVLQAEVTSTGANFNMVGEFHFHALAEYWQVLNANSLVGFSAWLSDLVGPETFNDYGVLFLSLPACAVFMVPGILLLLIFRGRRD